MTIKRKLQTYYSFSLNYHCDPAISKEVIRRKFVINESNLTDAQNAIKRFASEICSPLLEDSVIKSFERGLRTLEQFQNIRHNATLIDSGIILDIIKSDRNPTVYHLICDSCTLRAFNLPNFDLNAVLNRINEEKDQQISDNLPQINSLEELVLKLAITSVAENLLAIQKSIDVWQKKQ